MTMSVKLRLIQECNHKILTRVQTITSTPIYMKKGYRIDSSGSYALYNDSIDFIDSCPTISNVNELYVVENDVKRVISSDIYNLYKNTIVWLPLPSSLTKEGSYVAPTSGQEYYINGKYFEGDYVEYTALTCSRCYGKGWFLDIVKEGSNITTITGPYLVAQEFIQALLNTQGSDRLHAGYGASLFSNQVRYLNDQILEDVRTCVISAEMQVKALHSSDTSRTDQDRLNSVIVNNIEIDEDNLGIIINVTLITDYGNKITFNLNTTT